MYEVEEGRENVLSGRRKMSFVSYFVCCLVSRTTREVELGGQTVGFIVFTEKRKR